jgi:hypothetical protein
MKRLLIAVILASCISLVQAHADDAVFTCGNHHPSHSATTAADVIRLTKQYGCRDWHSSTADGKERLAEMKDALDKAYKEWVGERGHQNRK